MSGVEVRVFGSLRAHLERRGLPCQMELGVEAGGRSAASVAEELGIPPAEVEATFINGRVREIGTIVRSDDRLAFAPYGTPGPYRLFLGIVRASRGHDRDGRRGPRDDEGA